MSELVLCRICLRANVGAGDIPEFLIDLHDEICEYNVNANKLLKYCAICEHLLRKFHEFRKRCQQANKVLIKWNRNKNTIPPENLHKQLPQFPLGYSTNARCKVCVYQNDQDSDQDLESNVNIKSDISHIKTERDKDNSIIRENETETVFEEFLDNDLLGKEEVYDIPLIKQSDFLLFVTKEENDVVDNSEENDSSEENYAIDDSEESDVKDNSYLIIKREKPKPKEKAKVKRKPKKVKKVSDDTYEVDDKVVEELIEEYGENHKLVLQRRIFLRNKAKLKEKILRELDTGQFNELSDNVKMTEDVFNKIYDKYNINDRHVLKPVGRIQPEKLKKFLRILYRKYNPDYETVFDIEYLDTEKKILQEFNRRKDGRSYIEAPFKCELCYKGFMSQNFLDYHNKSHEPTPNDFVCEICQIRCPSKKRYRNHHNNNHSVVYTCRKCPMVIYNTLVMINHYNQHKGTEYQCPVCLSVFTNKTTLNNHRRRAHATSHICTACALSFVSEKGLYSHKLFKHKDEAEADPAEAALCTQCNITFDSHAVYLRHAKMAHKRRPESVYKCFFCKDGFDSIEALRKHKLELKHLRAPKQVVTPVGERPSGVIRPRGFRVTDPNMPYRKCPVCHVKVLNAYGTSLYVHYKEAHPNVPYETMSDLKSYLCEECGKTFRVYCHYLDHKNQHTGAKPYACKECPAQFAMRKHLVYHSERHRPPRYQCQQCEKMFRSAANLFAHRRSHIGDRRFKCDICFKGFVHPCTLNEHIRGVHNKIRRVRKLPSKEKKTAKCESRTRRVPCRNLGTKTNQKGHEVPYIFDSA